jgi:hypothetical protein
MSAHELHQPRYMGSHSAADEPATNHRFRVLEGAVDRVDRAAREAGPEQLNLTIEQRKVPLEQVWEIPALLADLTRVGPIPALPIHGAIEAPLLAAFRRRAEEGVFGPAVPSRRTEGQRCSVEWVTGVNQARWVPSEIPDSQCLRGLPRALPLFWETALPVVGRPSSAALPELPPPFEAIPRLAG